jgi:hypothetical protein
MVANRNILKAYAPQARKDFIRAMTDRAALFGVTKKGFTQGEERGDLFLIEGKAFPKVVAEQRKRLLARIEETSFDHVMEAVAYTWFNRFLAIRYMELHGYFDHGYRVLSHPSGEREPEILQQAQHLNLPGLDPKVVVELKLEGDKDDVLYRRILIAQCNGLHKAMPFLFERIDDETELLLPENLLQSDSIVRALVNSIAESEWDEIEIIGWLYQFYISEKKDQVIGKVVKSEDIPAATQLFTPNWIVKYMVQNSLGAQWMASYPDSPLKAAMAYYIEPTEQTPEVQSQLDAITPKTLDPEAITLIDPAVGSGHILVEAYDLFRAIYIERGYTPQAAARAILTKNLYGLDIDDRAAQMAGFALLMKARADDRTLLSDPPVLNVRSLTDSGGWDAADMADALIRTGRVELLPPADLLPETLSQPTLSVSAEERGVRTMIVNIVALFDGAKTFGSLITVPDAVMESLPILEALLARPVGGDLLTRGTQINAREKLAVLVIQAKLLGLRYDCVVANPPYLSSRSMNVALKGFLERQYKPFKNDLFSAFVGMARDRLLPLGRCGIMSPNVWLYLSSHRHLREQISPMLTGLIELPLGAFKGATVQICTFTFCAVPRPDFKATFVGLTVHRGGDHEMASYTRAALREPNCSYRHDLAVGHFAKIPGSPIAYWISPQLRQAFASNDSVARYAYASNGIQTGNNDRFVRNWSEVSYDKIIKMDWVPYNKGGAYRKWYGNNDYVVEWSGGGLNIKTQPNSCIRGEERYLTRGITWSDITSSRSSYRFFPDGYVFDAKGPSAFCEPAYLMPLLGLLNSNIVVEFSKILNPTLSFQIGDFRNIPVPHSIITGCREECEDLVSQAIDISRSDWDQYETSRDFGPNPVLAQGASTLAEATAQLVIFHEESTQKLKNIETAINSITAQCFRLEREFSSTVDLGDVTLTANPHYRYGGDLTDAERASRLLSDTMRELVSYGVGLMMGRYSLAEPRLIYAHAGNAGFDPGRYGAFPADDDGIVPITEDPWFADDAATRIEQFLAIAWPKAPVNDTLASLTDGLTEGKGDEPRAALRGYLAKTFYKDHLQTYRNRPIYWLFSSGKLKAFECLVYLHRYNESTLARMRTAYVTPLMGKMQQRITDLEVEIATSASSAEKTRKGRERENLVRQLAELRTFDEELRHLADQRIRLDLDDGVKVNYGRFGNLLAAKDKVRGKDDKED